MQFYSEDRDIDQYARHQSLKRTSQPIDQEDNVPVFQVGLDFLFSSDRRPRIGGCQVPDGE